VARVPAAIQRRVTSKMIDRAIEAIRAGASHNFADSTDYDVLLPTGERLPPKAVFGLALENVIREPATPYHFAAGHNQPSFQIIQAANYLIVPKGLPIDEDERTWAEGALKVKVHLAAERRSTLASAKKREFRRTHGHLFCERCLLIPSETLGPFGDACIEVHHAHTPVAKMEENHLSKLSHLQCLCANCHKVVHREMAQAERDARG